MLSGHTPPVAAAPSVNLPTPIVGPPIKPGTLPNRQGHLVDTTIGNPPFFSNTPT